MKFVAPLLIALGVALPSIASAMTPEQSLHSDKARAIFEQIKKESVSDPDN